MKNLFLIDGASGTGKSDLVKWLRGNNDGSVGFVKKGTTRKKRHNEAGDLEFLSKKHFESKGYDYKYTYAGAQYGLYQTEITRELLRYDNVVVIVRNTDTIKKIASEHKFVNVVRVFIYTDRVKLKERLLADGALIDEIEFRMERIGLAEKDYYLHPDVYDVILINNSSIDAFHQTISKIVAKYASRPSIDPYLISVMMSFNPKNKILDDSFDAMEAAVHEISSKYKCRRVDKAPGSPKIAEEFRNLIASSRCIIVDLTENKQNVYYELGYIQASHKTCVITAHEETKPFFYPREHKIIFYSSARELRERLQSELRGLLHKIPL